MFSTSVLYDQQHKILRIQSHLLNVLAVVVVFVAAVFPPVEPLGVPVGRVQVLEVAAVTGAVKQPVGSGIMEWNFRLRLDLENVQSITWKSIDC